LLELGIGFHPDSPAARTSTWRVTYSAFAGRIDALMSEIEAFAEIGDNMDNPVRTY
jgi:lipopolysaccharide transport system ATP-binding protein